MPDRLDSFGSNIAVGDNCAKHAVSFNALASVHQIFVPHGGFVIGKDHATAALLDSKLGNPVYWKGTGSITGRQIHVGFTADGRREVYAVATQAKNFDTGKKMIKTAS